MKPLAVVLLVLGYLVAVAVLARLLPVLAQRRRRWLVALEVAMAAIVVGWGLLGRPVLVVVNGAGLLGFAVAWAWTGRRR